MAYDDMTVDELKDELDKRDLTKSGNKEDLVARLELDDEERGQVQGTAPPPTTEKQPLGHPEDSAQGTEEAQEAGEPSDEQVEAQEGTPEGTTPPPTPHKTALPNPEDAAQASEESQEAGEPSDAQVESQQPDPEEGNEGGPEGTAPGPSHIQTRAATGLPAQMRPENQDDSVKGRVYNERGELLREDS